MGEFKTFARKLESAVPNEYRKSFAIMEEEPKFNLAAAPAKQMPDAPQDEMPPEGEAPPAPEETETPEASTDESPDETTWPIKKLVGVLRWAGALASLTRGANPQEAYEVLTKLQKELSEIEEQLKPFVDEVNPDDVEPVSDEEIPAEDEPLDSNQDDEAPATQTKEKPEL